MLSQSAATSVVKAPENIPVEAGRPGIAPIRLGALTRTHGHKKTSSPSSRICRLMHLYDN
jgi:hypothetical protein